LGDVKSASGRLGVRMTHTGRVQGHPVTTWARFNLWSEFSADPETSFSSDAGFVPFHADMRLVWGEYSGGVSIGLPWGVTVHAKGSYHSAFGEKFEAWNINTGLRVNW